MKNKTIFITLTPQQLFFFGGEQGEKADYFVKGSFIPQQTALLGLIRHQVLLQNNLMQGNKIIDDTEAAKWIGPKSFEYDKENKFGEISSISPCYIVFNGEIHQKYLPHYQSFIDGIKKIDGNYFLPDYDPKNHYPTLWKEVNNSTTIKETDCYEEVERIGVDKNYSGKTENESFFKQIWLKMKKGYSFGFYCTISEDVTLNSTEVTFGKESAPFLMEVHDIPFESVKNAATANAFVLISDAFASCDFINYSDFADCDNVSFRNNINPTSRIHNYYSIHKSTVRLQLLKRGSVFLAKEKNFQKLQDELNQYSEFQNIGYNHFQLIKIEY